MKIKTITCHDVYNIGASLQAYALIKYLQDLGHDAVIIDYKPDYLCNHYPLLGVNNPAYDRFLLREAYQLAKLPGRIMARFGKRKREFDCFTKKYLPVTQNRYRSNEELQQNPPEADVYFAGSDQIWNTMFQNGKDPAFYLEFAPEKAIKASYAASFSTESIPEEWRMQIRERIEKLDFVSVREKTGLNILSDLDIENAVEVLDPVFLLDKECWEKLEKPLNVSSPFLLLYDFDHNPEIRRFTENVAKDKGWMIYSILPCSYSDRSFEREGPQVFLWLIHHTEFVVSNSFHATAFALLYQKQFAVFSREEMINTRMRDLLDSVDLAHRLIGFQGEVGYEHFTSKDIDYADVKLKLEEKILYSKNYICHVLDKANRMGN